MNADGARTSIRDTDLFEIARISDNESGLYVRIFKKLNRREQPDLLLF